LAYFEVSAKENTNIDEVFFHIATEAFKVDAAQEAEREAREFALEG
jgi:GTPase SAR1 family protein